MRKQCYKGDEQFTACIETDGVGCIIFKSLSPMVKGLDKFEHCSSLNLMSDDLEAYGLYTI